MAIERCKDHGESATIFSALKAKRQPMKELPRRRFHVAVRS
jgi:hypothetical protein